MLIKLYSPTVDRDGNPGSQPSPVRPEVDHPVIHVPEFMPGDIDGSKWKAEQLTPEAIEAAARAEYEAALPDQVLAAEYRLKARELAAENRKQAAAIERGETYVTGAIDLDDFLGEVEPPPDWVIPGLLERQDRVIVTGLEGSGKTVLSRQIAMCAASGVHPFDLTMGPVKPMRVLVVDLENPTALVRRGYRGLRAVAGERYQKGNLTIASKPEGMDLVGNDGAELRKEIAAAGGEIDLLVIGPLYKMVQAGDISEEPVARDLTMTLDRLRIEYGFALWIEAHAPHQQAQGNDPAKLTMRPYGASLFKRWPEFGYFIHWDALTGVGQLIRWRADRQPDRVFPPVLRRGGAWPWTSPASEEDLVWTPIARAAEKHAAENKGAVPSLRVLAEAVGMTKSTLDRFLKLEATRWDLLKGSLLERYGAPPKVHEGQGIITVGSGELSQIDRE